MIELFIGIVQAIIAILSAIIEAIAGLFMVGGEALGVGELFVVLVVVIIELNIWAFLWLYELIKSLLGWRKPRRVPKPIIWRPKKKSKEADLHVSKNKS